MLAPLRGWFIFVLSLAIKMRDTEGHPRATDLVIISWESLLKQGFLAIADVDFAVFSVRLAGKQFEPRGTA